MKVAMFKSNPSTTVICYNPTNASDETDVITFYKELSCLFHSIPKQRVLIIGGDMNAEIGKDENNKFCLLNSSNRNGEHLTESSLENRLTCLNTKFQKRKGKLWTNANNAKAQIDYILINKKWINSTLNCEAYSSFDGVSSDDRIVQAKIRLSLHRNTMQITKTIHYDWSLLNNRDISNKYTIALRNKFDALQEISKTLSPYDEYDNFINAHVEAAIECIPTKLRTKYRVPWETLAVRKKGDNVKTTFLCNKRNPTNVKAQKLKKAQSELINAYQKEQIECIQGQINKIRNSAEDRQYRIAWLTVDEMSKRKSNSRAKLKAASQEERIQMLKERYKNLLGNYPKITNKSITKTFNN